VIRCKANSIVITQLIYLSLRMVCLHLHRVVAAWQVNLMKRVFFFFLWLASSFYLLYSAVVLLLYSFHLRDLGSLDTETIFANMMTSMVIWLIMFGLWQWEARKRLRSLGMIMSRQQRMMVKAAKSASRR
jgi:hypothetical protein